MSIVQHREYLQGAEKLRAGPRFGRCELVIARQIAEPARLAQCWRVILILFDG